MNGAELLTFASAWVATGMVFVAILYRRGHVGLHWFAVGAIAGPLTALCAADQARFVEPDARPLAVGAGELPVGGMIVVAPARLDDLAAVAAAVDRLDPAGRVAVLATVPYDSFAEAAVEHRRLDATADLDRAAAMLASHQPRQVLMPGTMPDAVVRYAVEHGASLLVVARAAHSAATLARLGRLAANREGLSVVIADPTLARATTTA